MNDYPTPKEVPEDLALATYQELFRLIADDVGKGANRLFVRNVTFVHHYDNFIFARCLFVNNGEAYAVSTKVPSCRTNVT